LTAYVFKRVGKKKRCLPYQAFKKCVIARPDPVVPFTAEY